MVEVEQQQLQKKKIVRKARRLLAVQIALMVKTY